MIETERLAQQAEQAERFLRQLSSRHRLMALCQLSEGECTVGELHRRSALSQSSLSQHLAVLREAGVVETRRCQQHVYYRLADPRVIDLLTQICQLGDGLKPDSEQKLDEVSL